MALLTIRKDEDPILRKKSRKVTEFDEKLKQLVDDMIETMIEEQGVGLAAVQVGKLRQVITYDEHQGDGSFVLINPEIVASSGDQRSQEACLSVTDKYGYVIRPTSITVKANDLDGQEITLDAKDNLARILCHEIDHLHGILFTDKVVEYIEDDYEDDEES